MKKAQKPETAPEELLEENTGVETNTENQSEATETSEKTVEEIIEEENQTSSADDGDIAGGGPKNPPTKDEEENSLIGTININDGSEGDAGQESINDIDVDLTTQEDEKDALYVNALIKLSNLLTDFKLLKEKEISIEKDEKLELVIVYLEQSIKSVENIRV